MKTHFLRMLYCVLFFSMFGCNTHFKKALKDFNNMNVSQQTIHNLEIASEQKSTKLESYYLLGLIYHMNPNLQDLNKAKKYYNLYNDNYYVFRNKKSRTPNEIYSKILEVDDLIDLNNFKEYKKLNTIKGYSDFIGLYPKSKYLNEAKEEAFNIAYNSDNFDSFKEYDNLISHKNDRVKDKAFEKAQKMNTLDSYYKYFTLFPNYKSSSLYQSAYDYANSFEKGLDVNTWNKYISLFPNSHLLTKAIGQRDMIEVVTFWLSISKLSFKEQILLTDQYCFDNNNNSALKDLFAEINTKFNELTKDKTEDIFQKYYNLLYSINAKSINLKDWREYAMERLCYSVFDLNNLFSNYDSNKIDNYKYAVTVIEPSISRSVKTLRSIISKYPLLSKSLISNLNTNINHWEVKGKMIPAWAMIRNYKDFSLAEHKKNIIILEDLAKKDISTEQKEALKQMLEYTIELTCTTCSGSGKVPERKCPTCKGRGEDRCTYTTTLTRNESSGAWGGTEQKSYSVSCRGGRLMRDNPYYNELCHVCNGTGKIDCSRCNGWGVITECDKCNGYGLVKYKYYEYYKK